LVFNFKDNLFFRLLQAERVTNLLNLLLLPAKAMPEKGLVSEKWRVEGRKMGIFTDFLEILVEIFGSSVLIWYICTDFLYKKALFGGPNGSPRRVM
jgi:hypothetical protein